MNGYRIQGITPEGYANLLLQEMGMALIPPIDPYYICTMQHIQIAYEPLDHADAALLRIGSSAEIMLNSNNQYRSRDRFSVAHELGHYYLPGHSDMEYYCTIKEILQYRSSNKKEHEANQFAAELLIPTLWLKNRIKASDISLSLIKKIAEECHTSLTATAIKIIKICRDRVGTAYSENGIIKWTAKSKSFSYELREGQVDERSRVKEFFQTGNLSEEPMQVPLFIWTSSPGLHEFLIEESISMPYLGAVLTVLTVPVDEDDDAWLDEDSW